MPANVVHSPEQERLWNKAKARAEKQGRAKDWQYVMGIFKRMGGLEKSLVPAPFRLQRTPGQVPSRERMMELREQRDLERMPRRPDLAQLLQNTDPMGSASSVVRGLGFNAQGMGSWERFLEKAVASAPNELVLRQAVVAQAREDRLQPELRQAILERALSFWRTARKSMVEVVTVDELKKSGPSANADLQKAEPRGGAYHRRVPQDDGGYRYIYDPEKYQSRPDAHVDGREARKVYLHGRISREVEGCGEEGCDPKMVLEKFSGKFSPEEIREALKGGCAGKLEFKKGRLYLRTGAAGDTAKSEQPKFFIRR